MKVEEEGEEVLKDELDDGEILGHRNRGNG